VDNIVKKKTLLMENKKGTVKTSDNEQLSDSDADFDEFLDWRSKKVTK